MVKQGTPTMGGIIIMITLILLSIMSKDFNIISLALIIIGFGVVGLVDDFKKLILKDTEGLKPAYKVLRIISYFCNICIIFNKKWNRNR